MAGDKLQRKVASDRKDYYGDVLVLGRVIDPIGRPLDDGRALSGLRRLNCERDAPAIMGRSLALHGVSSVLILGPGKAKWELGKLIQSKKVRGRAVESETADKMTDRQLTAKVSQHFATSTVAKAKAPKKAAQTTPAKRAK